MGNEAVDVASDTTHAETNPAGKRRASWPWTLYTWTVVLGGLGIGAFFCFFVGGPAALFGDTQRHVAHRMLRLGYGIIVRLLRFRLTVSGLENLTAAASEGGVILCPNHQSYADVVYLYALPLPFKWVVKRELFWAPFFGPAMRLARYPAIRRGDAQSAENLLHTLAGLLAAGENILQFPEGTRSPTGELGGFQSGAARLALKSGAPLVPIGVYGTFAILPRHSLMYPARGHVHIHVGPPLTFTEPRPTVRGLTRALREAVDNARTQAAARVSD